MDCASSPGLGSQPSGGGDPSAKIMVDRFIAQHNIEYFHALLSKETDEGKRQTLLRLLAEEEVKLAPAIAAEKQKPKDQVPSVQSRQCAE
jgi:hypothetical protein